MAEEPGIDQTRGEGRGEFGDQIQLLLSAVEQFLRCLYPIFPLLTYLKLLENRRCVCICAYMLYRVSIMPFLFPSDVLILTPDFRCCLHVHQQARPSCHLQTNFRQFLGERVGAVVVSGNRLVQPRDLGYPDTALEPVRVAGLIDHDGLDADESRHQQRGKD